MKSGPNNFLKRLEIGGIPEKVTPFQNLPGSPQTLHKSGRVPQPLLETSSGDQRLGCVRMRGILLRHPTLRTSTPSLHLLGPTTRRASRTLRTHLPSFHDALASKVSGKVGTTGDRTVLAGSRDYPMSSFVYLLPDNLLPLLLRTAKSAPPTTRPPNTTMITMGTTYTSK